MQSLLGIAVSLAACGDDSSAVATAVRCCRAFLLDHSFNCNRVTQVLSIVVVLGTGSTSDAPLLIFWLRGCCSRCHGRGSAAGSAKHSTSPSSEQLGTTRRSTLPRSARCSVEYERVCVMPRPMCPVRRNATNQTTRCAPRTWQNRPSPL